ncbi:MAG: right-handed parallel beta-helix repeat-containing protein [Anaerocolumna sp.]
MKKYKVRRSKYSIFIGLTSLFLLASIWIVINYMVKSNNDATYGMDEAYVFDNSYTYGVNAPKSGAYTLVVSGSDLDQKKIKVNGLEQTLATGKKATIHLNKGINTVTFIDGQDIDKITIKDAGKRRETGGFVTYDSYEAEECKVTGEISDHSRIYRDFASEASQRGYVALKNTGDYISLQLKRDTNALVIRYAIPDSEDGNGLKDSLSLYFGKDKTTIEVTSKYSWVYGNFPWSNDPRTADKGGPHMFFDDVRVKLDKTYPAGTELKIMKDMEDTAAYYLIDCIETEEIDEPLQEPPNALNIMDYGAVPNDGIDDAQAIDECIAQAIEEDKEVYLPAGVFEIGNPVFVRGFVLKDNNITIRGAGMWHTILHGNTAAFTVRAGNISFYDFSLLGEVTSRKDSIDPPAFSLVTPVKGMENITIQNIWMEHWKVGIWADVTNGMNIVGCRIRNTFADGINLCAGTSNSVVTQNDIRNTGDDGIAMFNRGVLDENNKVLYNTVSLPWLANNIALYGGKDIVIKGNWLKDTICFGGGINISTNFKPQVFEGTILVEGNKLERCGSKENNINADYGAIWINTVNGYDNLANTIIRENEILDSTYQGISFFNSGLVENIRIEDNQIKGVGTYGVEVGKEVRGFAVMKDNHISGSELDLVHTNENESFEIYEK